MKDLRTISEQIRDLKDQELRDLRLKSIRLAQVEELLRNLVTHARPSFPKTPFRKALDEAKEYLGV